MTVSVQRHLAAPQGSIKTKATQREEKVGEESECNVMSVCVYMYRDQVRDERRKAKNKVRPNGKRTYEPQKEEMVVNVQQGSKQGSSKQIEEMEMTKKTESDACNVEHET